MPRTSAAKTAGTSAGKGRSKASRKQAAPAPDPAIRPAETHTPYAHPPGGQRHAGYTRSSHSRGG